MDTFKLDLLIVELCISLIHMQCKPLFIIIFNVISHILKIQRSNFLNITKSNLLVIVLILLMVSKTLSLTMNKNNLF